MEASKVKCHNEPKFNRDFCPGIQDKTHGVWHRVHKIQVGMKLNQYLGV
ncbi:hypothetical protein L917_13789 [Phytophthora nicotianae]|uniref:Uncharacterized protein n=2 Tax=Phytophthora nicotianae TaxID=4792 RepID=W2PVP4_PHYN3|nr:hypothetical protein PPTG_23583 [Phytophthora nicotianae INRA-310]ETL86860.1 hypothetical protein L917_13789 [Phytophthora nicotianae]ETN04711.1 hypothetical protein PPTG_23583 [Phytophthora nicotianae INRA-310]